MFERLDYASLCSFVWQAICRRNEFVEKERIHKVWASHVRLSCFYSTISHIARSHFTRTVKLSVFTQSVSILLHLRNFFVAANQYAPCPAGSIWTQALLSMLPSVGFVYNAIFSRNWPYGAGDTKCKVKVTHQKGHVYWLTEEARDQEWRLMSTIAMLMFLTASG